MIGGWLLLVCSRGGETSSMGRVALAVSILWNDRNQPSRETRLLGRRRLSSITGPFTNILPAFVGFVVSYMFRPRCYVAAFFLRPRSFSQLWSILLAFKHTFEQLNRLGWTELELTRTNKRTLIVWILLLICTGSCLQLPAM